MRSSYTGLCFTVAAALLWQPRVLGGAAAPAVPFDLLEQHLLVAKGSIGGLHNLHLLIDTGSIPSVVDEKVARKLK